MKPGSWFCNYVIDNLEAHRTYGLKTCWHINYNHQYQTFTGNQLCNWVVCIKHQRIGLSYYNLTGKPYCTAPFVGHSWCFDSWYIVSPNMNRQIKLRLLVFLAVFSFISYKVRLASSEFYCAGATNSIHTLVDESRYCHDPLLQCTYKYWVHSAHRPMPCTCSYFGKTKIILHTLVSCRFRLCCRGWIDKQCPEDK